MSWPTPGQIISRESLMRAAVARPAEVRRSGSGSPCTTSVGVSSFASL
ncbi:hypothetical protein ABEG17_16415 [Pedococcus sp. KACC 23699]|uniref:Uncharacterized protein n=1 Tax=Pedococcus sp. KACC 23699 TaxID=3149228 RepID=A0AAU7JSP7_9MICO